MHRPEPHRASPSITVAVTADPAVVITLIVLVTVAVLVALVVPVGLGLLVGLGATVTVPRVIVTFTGQTGSGAG
jgi:hypothetical protein